MFGAAVLGIDAGSWGVIVAGLALLVALYGAVSARGAESRADRAVDATVASARAAERSAVTAEQSSLHAQRSADASERLAAANERLADSDHARANREQQERRHRDAPRWLPVSADQAGYWNSDSNRFWGSLQNDGAVTASVTGVELDLPSGGRVVGAVGYDPGAALGSRIDIQAGRPIFIEFRTTDGSLALGLSQGSVSPRVRITASSDELDWSGQLTVEFLRKGSTGGADGAMWEPRRK